MSKEYISRELKKATAYMNAYLREKPQARIQIAFLDLQINYWKNQLVRKQSAEVGH